MSGMILFDSFSYLCLFYFCIDYNCWNALSWFPFCNLLKNSNYYYYSNFWFLSLLISAVYFSFIASVSIWFINLFNAADWALSFATLILAPVSLLSFLDFGIIAWASSLILRFMNSEAVYEILSPGTLVVSSIAFWDNFFN